MKTKLLILLVLLFSFSIPSSAQEKSKKELKAERESQKQKEIEVMINSKNFVFDAHRVIPQGGRLLNLDYNTYFLKFNETRTICDLPFFGRGFSVPYGSGDGGIKFEGTPEDIKIVKKNKSYNIKAVVKGNNDIYNLFFTIFSNGNASLLVNSNNRSPVSYDGEIKKQDTEKVKE